MQNKIEKTIGCLGVFGRRGTYSTDEHGVELKKCTYCLEFKTFEMFGMKTVGYINSHCKKCHAKFNKNHRLRANMNQQKMTEIYNNFPAATKRVFDSIPKIEPWVISKISDESYRSSNVRFGQQAMALALNSLVSAGIVVEPKKGMFMRTKLVVKEPVMALKSVKKSSEFDVMVSLLEFTNEIEKIVSMKAVQDGLFYDAMTKIRMKIDDFSVVADEFMNKPHELDEETKKALAELKQHKEYHKMMNG